MRAVQFVTADRRWAAIGSAVFVVIVSLAPAWASTFYYTHGGADGGVGVVEIDPESGKFLCAEALISPPLDHPKKLAITDGGSHLIVTAEEAKIAWTYALGETPQYLDEIPLDATPSDVVAYGSNAFLAATDGYFYEIDVPSAEIKKKWNSKDGLTPPGRHGESIYQLGGQRVFISFQKDDKQGKSQGSRLVLFDLNDFNFVHDLQFPRDRPDLHIDSDLREQGPNPEVIFVAPKSNAVIASLDLYGALAVADLDAALRGDWKNLEYFSTALDGSWGNAFPDRGTLFEIGGKDYLLIANASEDGGLVLFDVAARKVIQTFEASAGAEHPVFLPHLKKVVTVVSGKVKLRTQDGLDKKLAPDNDLIVIDVAALETGGAAVVERIQFENPVTRVAAIDSKASPIILLVTGENEFVTYDVTEKAEMARTAAAGTVNRLAMNTDD